MKNTLQFSKYFALNHCMHCNFFLNLLLFDNVHVPVHCAQVQSSFTLKESEFVNKTYTEKEN